jgi:thiamine-phosphate pyrophosphorylase
MPMAEPTGQHPFELCLAIPAHAGGAVAPAALAPLLAGGDIACVVLFGEPSGAGHYGPLDDTIARTILDIAQHNGVAALIAHDIDAAKRLGADGVHILANEERYAKARSVLGREANIGASCGVSRHDAMVMAEIGADYVSFGADLGFAAGGTAHDVAAEMTVWWAEVFEPPCMTWCSGPDDGPVFYQAGADFLGVGPWLWDGPDDVRDRLTRLIGALAD